jgi:hypothetical protein
VTFPGGVFNPDSLSLGDRILILHYLTSNGPVSENPAETTFQSLPGGMFYFSTFRKRGPNRVLAEFGGEPETVAAIRDKLGWAAGEVGDVSVRVPALPRIPVTVVLHAGDDEFPPEVQFLFRDDITSFLPLEDVAVLGGTVATRLSIAAGELK